MGQNPWQHLVQEQVTDYRNSSAWPEPNNNAISISGEREL
jgi:hypothetical protein